jgi:transposase
MKCGPDDCHALTNFSDLTPAEQKVERKRRAVKMTEQGFTQQHIAKLLGVSQSTIRDDLSNLVETTKSKPAKTATNPKGAGRPKGSKKDKPRTETEQEQVAAKLRGMGKSIKEIASEIGVGERRAGLILDAVKVREAAEATIDPATLSLTAQQKLELAIKQATRRLEIEIEKRVREENLRWIQKMLDQHNANAKHYEAVLKVRKGIMTRAEYRSILSCLHPDRVQDDILKKRYERAFNFFTDLEKLVLSEQDSPTVPSGLPKTAAEFLKRKAEYAAQRAAKRNGASNVAVK